MYILSQDKTRIYNMSGHIEGIGYEESKDYKQRKTENIRHTIQVFDGCAEEIAEFKTKEDCMLVIYAIFKGMEQDSKAVEIPTQEEMEKQKDLIKQLAEHFHARTGRSHRLFGQTDDFHRIAQRSNFAHEYVNTFGDSHIHDSSFNRTGTVELYNFNGFSYGSLF